MMLRERVNIIIIRYLPFQQRLDVRKQFFLLIRHVVIHKERIFIIYLNYQSRKIITLVERTGQFLSNERQLEIKVILMARLQIL